MFSPMWLLGLVAEQELGDCLVPLVLSNVMKKEGDETAADAIIGKERAWHETLLA